MNYLQGISFGLIIITSFRFILYLLAFTMAGVALKLNWESNALDRVLKVLLFVALYPRHGKYFKS